MRFLPVLLVVLFSAGPVRAEHVYEDAWLRIRGDVPETWIETAADLGKALYKQLGHHFGTFPPEAELPLELVLYPDQATFRAGLRSAGHRDSKHESSGGFTDWKRGISRVWLQTDAFHTRRLVLHELVHQFHDKCQDPSRRGKGAFWYREGLAEWFGWHRRMGHQVRFGALDAVARGGTRAQALERMSEGIYPAWDIAIESKPADYADGLCLVAAFLGTEDEKFKARFRSWEKVILKRGGGGRSFLRAFAGMHADVGATVRIFWNKVPAPWETTSPRWDEKNEFIAGRAPEGDAVLWAPAGLTSRAAVTIYLGEGESAQAGFRLRTGKDHPEVAAVLGAGSMAILRREHGGWKPIASRTTTLSGSNARLRLRTTSNGELVLAAKAEDGDMALHAPLAAFGIDPGVSFLRVGLFVRNGSARFWDFDAKQR